MFEQDEKRSELWRELEESERAIRETAGDFKPEIAIILGSGLGYLAGEVEGGAVIDYGLIPHFLTSTAPGHAGRLVLGDFCGKSVAMMQGRFHCYEGYNMRDVVYPVRVLRKLGVKTLIVTNAAGAVNTSFNVGDLMLITDHIKLVPQSPLIGENCDELGPRFPDMTHAYSPALREKAKAAARELGITLREGVYMYFSGPQFETPAEVRVARLLGADANGMSTVPEVIAANHCGMDVLGVSLMTNMAAGILDQPLSGEEVNEAAEHAKPQFSALLRKTVELI